MKRTAILALLAIFALSSTEPLQAMQKGRKQQAKSKKAEPTAIQQLQQKLADYNRDIKEKNIQIQALLKQIQSKTQKPKDLQTDKQILENLQKELIDLQGFREVARKVIKAAEQAAEQKKQDAQARSEQECQAQEEKAAVEEAQVGQPEVEVPVVQAEQKVAAAQEQVQPEPVVQQAISSSPAAAQSQSEEKAHRAQNKEAEQELNGFEEEAPMLSHREQEARAAEKAREEKLRAHAAREAKARIAEETLAAQLAQAAALEAREKLATETQTAQLAAASKSRKTTFAKAFLFRLRLALNTQRQAVKQAVLTQPEWDNVIKNLNCSELESDFIGERYKNNVANKANIIGTQKAATDALLAQIPAEMHKFLPTEGVYKAALWASRGNFMRFVRSPLVTTKYVLSDPKNKKRLARYASATACACAVLAYLYRAHNNAR